MSSYYRLICIQGKQIRSKDFILSILILWLLKQMLPLLIGHQDIIYAFPPFNLIPPVLQKIENEKSEGILIVPRFVNQSWFTRLLTLLIKEPLWQPSSDISLTFPFRRKSISYLPKTRLMVCYVSGDACNSRVFRAKLQKLSSNFGDQGRVGNMISIHLNG